MGAEKIWCGGVDCATGAEDVCQWRSRVHLGEGYIEVKVGVHQVSILSLKPCHVFCSRVPWEDLYADDLVIIAEFFRGICREALNFERSNGGERTE